MSQRVRILHPGYTSSNVLFLLAATDRDERDHVHYPTLWDACSIVINNRRDHWLSISRTGTPQASANADSLLAAGDYFLHLPGSEDETAQPYPIVPTFRAWQFPHDHLPELWLAASRNDELLAAQENFALESVAVEKCRITDRKLATQVAHIIPKEEKPWFTSNGMQDYGPVSTRSGETMADILSNKMRLRADGHILWDRCDFSIVPREVAGRAAWYTQVMNDGEELHKYWHRNALLPLSGRPTQYLYARFAYNLFAKLHGFLHGGRARFLVVCGIDGTVEERQFSAQECRQLTENQGKNRSVSPKKRSRGGTDIDDSEFDGLETRDEEPIGSRSVDSAMSGLPIKRRRSNTPRSDTDGIESHGSGLHERGRKRWREHYY